MMLVQLGSADPGVKLVGNAPGRVILLTDVERRGKFGSVSVV